jgi:hypothetical protein
VKGKAAGGWATAPERRQQLFTYLPYGPDDPEPAYTLADAFEPPHPLAVPPDLCDRILAACEAGSPASGRTGPTSPSSSTPTTSGRSLTASAR